MKSDIERKINSIADPQGIFQIPWSSRGPGWIGHLRRQRPRSHKCPENIRARETDCMTQELIPNWFFQMHDQFSLRKCLLSRGSLNCILFMGTYSGAYQREAPIRGTPLWKKQPDLFWQKINIIGKKGQSISKSVESGKHPLWFYRVQICAILFTRKEIIITLWPNRNDNDRVSIFTIDVDLQADERSERAFVCDPSKNHEALVLYLPCS
jgi:hypothetical protein